MALAQTPTRATLSVPAPSPETSMSLGSTWNGTPWASEGFCVNTDGRIWLDANGATSSSTFGALANGGQLLMQSLSDSVYLISQQSAVIATNGGAFLAGGGGVKLIAGHGAPTLFTPDDHTLENVRPDETSPSSAHAAAYTDYMDEVANAWTITDTVMAGFLTALDVGLTVADCYGGGGPSGLGAALLVLGSAANLAGGAVNIAGMSGAELPGLNLHAFSGITLATTGFCSMYSGAGMLLAGLTTQGLGFLTAGVTASVNAALKSLGFTTVEGKTVEMTGMKSFSFGARTGDLKVYGPSMLFGSKGGESKTQQPTMSIDASSVLTLDVKAHAGDVTMTTAGLAENIADAIEVESAGSVSIKGPTYEVVVAPNGITLTFNKTTMVKAELAKWTAVAGAMGLELTAQGFKLGGSASSMEAEVAGAWKWKSAAFTFL